MKTWRSPNDFVNEICSIQRQHFCSATQSLGLSSYLKARLMMTFPAWKQPSDGNQAGLYTGCHNEKMIEQRGLCSNLIETFSVTLDIHGYCRIQRQVTEAFIRLCGLTGFNLFCSNRTRKYIFAWYCSNCYQLYCLTPSYYNGLGIYSTPTASL